MFKSNKGFTLVELIVVIAILAILAGVAVPAYTGYIKKAEDAAVITELDAIKTAAQAANATAGEIGGIAITNAGVITVTPPEGKTLATNFDADFVMFYGEGKATAASEPANKTGDFTTTGLTGELAGTSYANGAIWSSADGWKAN